MRLLARSWSLTRNGIGIKQLPDIHTDRVGNIFEPRNRRGIDTSLYQPNETNGVVRFFRELFLGEVRREAEMGDILAEQSI